ncbi:AraC family transcriptional regulator [Flavihumibacter fluvii]|uniref:AraC family transcriptional regulator n=1 Tax=Flavihumibacter fluvii TaxID=2838157 RepID=UPI001BDF31A3|nr:AraC family transcriptional regulator [Flavihumibacter fluvii]ULQ51327.1 AraC family transcriptional regulator [Flavihumibacter fluvii]
MQTQSLYIKGMVCERCITTVKETLGAIGIEVASVLLGEVVLRKPTPIDVSLVEERLRPVGFQLLQDKKRKLVQDVKTLVTAVYSGRFDFPVGFRFSNYASEQLELAYDTISTIFAAEEQNTLEKYIIKFRIERIKELLVYSDKTLSDISFDLGFSSVAHLSKQFKIQTGLTPSHFKNIRKKKTETAD